MVEAAIVDLHIAEHAKASTEIKLCALQTISSAGHTDDHGDDIRRAQADHSNCRDYGRCQLISRHDIGIRINMLTGDECIKGRG